MNHEDDIRKPVGERSPSVPSPNPVNQRVYAAIQELDSALREQFHCDFAYSICGQGRLRATSNWRDGVVTPVMVQAAAVDVHLRRGKNATGKVRKDHHY